MISLESREKIIRDYLNGFRRAINQSLQCPNDMGLPEEALRTLNDIINNPEQYEQLFNQSDDFKKVALGALFIALSEIRYYHDTNTIVLEDANTLPGSCCISYEEVYDGLKSLSTYARLLLLDQIHSASDYMLLEKALIYLDQESFLKLKGCGLLSPLQYIFEYQSQLEESTSIGYGEIQYDNDNNTIKGIGNTLKKINRNLSIINVSVRVPSEEELSNPLWVIEGVDSLLNEISSYKDYEIEEISKYIDKPLFNSAYKHYHDLWEITKKDVKKEDITPKKKRSKTRIRYKVPGLSNMSTATEGINFQWSDSLKKWCEQHTDKFGDFVKYVAKDKGYIPNEQKQINAFIRTITGRNVGCCDEKVRLINNHRNNATRAMLYLVKCHIIMGNYSDIFTHFDVEKPENYKDTLKKNWMSGYASGVEKDFEITVNEIFKDFFKLNVP